MANTMLDSRSVVFGLGFFSASMLSRYIRSRQVAKDVEWVKQDQNDAVEVIEDLGRMLALLNSIIDRNEVVLDEFETIALNETREKIKKWAKPSE